LIIVFRRKKKESQTEEGGRGLFLAKNCGDLYLLGGNVRKLNHREKESLWIKHVGQKKIELPYHHKKKKI